MGENKTRDSVCGKYGGRDENDKNQAQNSQKETQPHLKSVTVNKPTSLGTLIVWNISKALENNPDIDLRSAMNAAQNKLGQESRDVSSIMSQYPEERYLACAILAWQQLGHEDADSLYHFYETNKFKQSHNNNTTTNKKETYCSVAEFKQEFKKDKYISRNNASSSYDSVCIGPVVKLPVQTKIVMRLENTPSGRRTGKKQKMPDKDIKDKIEAACCMETDCIERLAAVDVTTTELRTRAAKLARREAERVELLERAETAWKDLELGYQRRLCLAEEKEDDLSKQIKKLIDERNGYKSACMNLAQHLKEKGEVAEKERESLSKLEKEVCDRACIRLRLSEESARADATLNENQIKAAQLDRDLQFKEEQARHKLSSIEGEVSSARALTHETERALRAELGALREQVAQVSGQLLEEEAENDKIKQEIDGLEKEKMEIVEDLDGCKLMCDNRMQGRVDELQKKRAQLNELKDKVLECQCKLPVDANIEVKRTPSLAALCKCTPEEKLLESCSCTSLRSRLLSNLLADLFGGLQAELGGFVSNMPCQLLKCLEDKHNWDRSSIVKTNLQHFFSQLLIAELDIAIATSIEKYHAKWVGSTCADRAKLTAEPGEVEDEGWQERVLEQRAQKLASQLAEQLFQERAEQLTQRAKDIVMSGPPPCVCKPQAIFPCLVKPPRMPTSANAAGTPNNVTIPDYWRRTLKDITQLKLDIEDMRKRSVKKGDFKLMEENIVKIMERVSVLDTYTISPASLDSSNWKTGIRCENRSPKIGSNMSDNFVTSNKQSNIKKKKLDSNVSKKANKSVNSSRLNTDTLGKSYNKMGQTFAVNLCLCGTQNNADKMSQQRKLIVNGIQNDDKIAPWKQSPSKVMVPHISSIKQTKPINSNNFSSKMTYSKNNKVSDQPYCQKDCVCFHRLPSNTSIDRLLNMLTKWKCVLTHSVENYIEDTKPNEPAKHFELIDNVTNNKCDPKKKDDLNIHQEIGERTETICCNSQLNNNEVSSVSCNENLEIITKSDEPQPIIPPNNDSEYMAAINLDKSSENCCQCLNNTTKISNVSNGNKVKFPFKCINTNDCTCKQSIKSMNTKPTQPKLQTSSQINNKIHQHKPQSKENENITNIQVEENTSSTQSVHNDTRGHIIDDVNNSETCNCDYFINFLGVTLANINSKNKHNLPMADQNCDTKQSTLTDYCDENNYHSHITNCFSSNIENKLGKFNKPIVHDPTYIEYESKTITCKCKDNVQDKIKLNPVEDKGINVHESTYQTNLENKNTTQKSCVCCNFNNLEESKNLEENAFNLLEEYLKGKLNDFHKFSCKSSCVSSEEEGKMFSAILQNVKEVISEHIKQITCECSESERIPGNWNRAYGLLQEYLKIKIKRVQCLCITTEKASLPVKSVLDRVSSLIDHDFQRLKAMCKCNSVEETKKKSPSSIVHTDEIPVKDSLHYQQIDSLNTNYSSSLGNTNSCGIVQLNTNSPFTYTNMCSGRVNKDISNYYDNYYKDNIQNLERLKGNNSLKSLLDTENIANNVNKVSIETSNKSIILNRQISCQVPPNLGMVAKSCDSLEISTKNIQTVSIESKNADNFCDQSGYTTNCDCCVGFVKEDNNIFLGVGRTELLVNHCTELKKRDDYCNQMHYIDKKLCNHSLIEELHNTATHEIRDVTFSSKKLSSSIDNITPYLGCTIDCSCDERNLSSCICLKSVVQENHSKISDIWKKVTEKSCLQKISYLCSENTFHKGVKGKSDKCYKNMLNQNSGNTIISQVTDDNEKGNRINTVNRANQNVCNTKVSVHGEEDLVLKNSKEICEQMNNTTNTLDESVSLETNYSKIENPTDWYECPEICDSGTNLLAYKCGNCTHYPLDKYKYFAKQDIGKSTISLSNRSYHDCHCDMVPICHVKMLVENIENSLVNCSCTCDSLISDVCPIHSSKI